jgi:transposase
MKMNRISMEETIKLREAMKKATTVRQYRRLEAVALRGAGKKNAEISELTGFHPDVVGRYVKEYLEGGLERLLADGRKGGNHRNASDIEEREFIARFEEAAQKGQIVTVEEISKAYDKRFGKKHKSKSTVYYFLHKMGWRKIMPRSKHPKKASDEAIAASKKLTLASKN